MHADLSDLVVIETARLQLCELTQRVYDYVFSHFTETEIMAFFGHKTPEEAHKERTRYEAGLTTFNRSFYIFRVLDKATETMMGYIGFHTWYTVHSRAEIFYHILDADDRKKGYAKEALLPVIHFAFTEMKLNRIEAFLSPENAASMRLMEIAGFKKEGTLKEHYFTGDRYEDSDVYGLLKKDFKGELV